MHLFFYFERDDVTPIFAEIEITITRKEIRFIFIYRCSVALACEHRLDVLFHIIREWSAQSEFMRVIT